MKNFSFIIYIQVATLFLFTKLYAQQQTIAPLSVDGEIYSIAEDSNNVYIGGYFANVGTAVKSNNNTSPYVRNFICDTTWQSNIVTSATLSTINGWVSACVNDGNGGYFIGGNFNAPGSLKNLIHIDANNQIISSFAPNPDYDVLALHLIGNTIYVGGRFYNIGGVSKPYFTALNATTGAVFNITPTPDYIVKAFVQVGDTLYFGGAFFKVNGTQQAGIGAIRLSTNANLPMPVSVHSNLYDNIRTLTYDNIKKELYCGGIFWGMGKNAGGFVEVADSLGEFISSVYPQLGYISVQCSDGNGGWYLAGNFTLPQGISKLCHITAGKVLDTLFKPNPRGEVFALTVADSTLYIVGAFDSVSGVSRNYIAALNKITGAAQAWNPGCSNAPRCLLVDDSLIHVGGYFEWIGNKNASGFATLSRKTGEVKNTIGFSGTVWCMTQDKTSLYIGGNYAKTGKVAHNITSFHIPYTTPVYEVISVSGTPLVQISDNNGGWFFGGYFSTKQGLRHLIHVKSNGAIDTAFHPNPDWYVYSLQLKGDTLFVGGSFSQIYGQAYSNFASIRVSTGSLIPALSVSVNDDVNCMQLLGDTLYLGGTFSSVGGASRSRLASINIQTQTLTTWNPNLGGYAYALLYKDSGLYVGGTFSSIAGQPAVNLVRINMQSNTYSFFPPVNSTVRALAIQGSKLYLGGEFQAVGAVPRYYGASIDLPTLTLTSWNPSFNNMVLSIAASDSLIYCGGLFTKTGNTTRNYSACFDSLGTLNAWNPAFDGAVYNFLLKDSDIYVCGHFSNCNTKVRNGLCRINKKSNAFYAWNNVPNTGASFYTLAVNGSTLYAGGNFNSCGGQLRNNAAAVDIVTGNATTWNPNIHGQVNSLIIHNNQVYAGGTFDSVGTKEQHYCAAFDAITGNATSWNPSPGGYITSLTAGNKSIFLTGQLSVINVLYSRSLVAIKHNDWTIKNWNPDIKNGPINEIQINGNTLYVGGQFSTAGDSARHNLAAIDMATAKATAWNPNPDGQQIIGLKKWGNSLYAFGDFTTMNTVPRRYATSFNLSDGSLGNWAPEPNSNINYAAKFKNNFWIAGNFTLVHSVPRYALFSYSKATLLPNQNFNPKIDGKLVRTLLLKDSTLYFGGEFNGVNSVYTYGCAAVNKNSGTILPFYPKIAGVVKSLVLDGNTLYAGGLFNYVNSTLRRYICAVDAGNGSLLPFNPVLNNEVLALYKLNSTLLVGGKFSTINSLTRNRVASFDLSTGALNTWNPDANGFVRAFAVDGNNVFVAGDFTAIGGVVRGHVASVDKNTGAVNSFYPNLNNNCNTLLIKGNALYCGGNFTWASNQPVAGFATFNKNNGIIDSFLPSFSAMYNQTNYANINALAYGNFADNTLKAGGSFNDVNATPVSGLALFDFTIVPRIFTPFSANTTGNGILLYPNPVENKLYISGVGDKSYIVTVTNISGTELFHSQVEASAMSMEMDVASLPVGLYFVTFDDGVEVVKQKFVKQ